MEVHRHAHTPTEPGPSTSTGHQSGPDTNRNFRKKWTHYFWEFLMLFLAVFAGFLAENQREHFVEHQREKQFIRSLIYDLGADTARLNELINFRNIRELRLDSLTFLLNGDSAEHNSRDIYFFSIYIPRINLIQFTPNDGTMQQLKNAGGLRLIRKHFVADSILKYDAGIRSLVRLDQQEQEIINIQREMAPQIFNGLDLGKFSDANNLPVRTDYRPALMPGYKNSLNEFNYRLGSIKNVNKGYRREARRLLTQAVNLISILKKEY